MHVKCFMPTPWCSDPIRKKSLRAHGKEQRSAHSQWRKNWSKAKTTRFSYLCANTSVFHSLYAKKQVYIHEVFSFLRTFVNYVSLISCFDSKFIKINLPKEKMMIVDIFKIPWSDTLPLLAIPHKFHVDGFMFRES